MQRNKKSNLNGINRAQLTSKRLASAQKKRSIRGSVNGISFEPLEDRQLMTVINVADFGARPNDGVNDLPAIQAALNASQPGDTILFSGGTFNLSGFNGASGGNGLMLPSNRTYQGTNGATLSGHDTNGPQLSVVGDNVTISGLTFNGGGIKVDGNNAMAQNIKIDSNVFNLNTGGSNNNGITMDSGLRNSSITNNYFTGYTGTFGIYGYNYNGLTIANNEFVNITAGIHIDAFGGDGNLLVEQNYITGVKGMGMEFQTQGGTGTPATSSNLVFQDNWYENPNLSSNPANNSNSMAFSLILDRGANITIQRNVVIAPQRADGIGTRIGFEVGGDNTVVQDNYINGVNQTVAVNDGFGSCSVNVQNNKFMNYLESAGITFPSPGRTWQNTNNGPNTTLSATMQNRIANNLKPGIGSKRYGGTSTTTTTPPSTTPPASPPPAPSSPPATPPAATAPAAPTGLLAMATGGTTVNLFWSDKSNNETGYKVESSTDGKTFTTLATLAANTHGYTATGLTAGTTYTFRVSAFNSTGSSGYTNTATATPTANNPANGTYVSDLTPTNSTNYWGPAETDMSNGEQQAGDGHAITIDGKTYAKGLGVHGGSELDYALNGQYSTFSSDIGIDDETGGLGSVVFEVMGDGKVLYTSGTITAANSPATISVDVTGVQQLSLIVTNAGDGYNFDHADWAGAKLTPAAPVTPPATPTGDVTYISDMNWDSVANGWGTPELDKSNGERGSNDGHTLTLNGQTYAKGLGVHSNSNVQYSLDGKYSTFMSDIGIDDEVGDQGSVVFQVVGDGVTLFTSGVITGASPTQSISVNVAGVKELSLIVTDAGDGKNFDHADWADAKLISASTTSAPAAATTTGTTLLSSLPATSTSNGWGQVEYNTSVGEQLTGDGNAMSINGQSYTNGLGVHSDSKLVYNLNGQYSSFTTDVGVDDEVGNNGSVDFQIWTDGQMVYDSGVMTGADAAKTATVNVAGKNQLWLVVTNGGDNYNFDHADWANARLS